MLCLGIIKLHLTGPSLEDLRLVLLVMEWALGNFYSGNLSVKTVKEKDICGTHDPLPPIIEIDARQHKRDKKC
jgi:hypothetical protein